MNKKGASHVEVILAFVIFIVAVGFALYIFNPGSGDRIVESSLEYANREIMNNASTTVETFSVVTKTAGSGVRAFDFDGRDGKTRAEDENGDAMNSYNDGTYVYVDGIWTINKVTYIMFGDEFNQTTGLSAANDSSLYEIASSNVKEVLSERKMLDIKDEYDSDYNELKGKKGFNLPDRANFGFVLTFDDGSEIRAQQEAPASVEIFTTENRVEVLRTDGDIEYSNLVVEIW